MCPPAEAEALPQAQVRVAPAEPAVPGTCAQQPDHAAQPASVDPLPDPVPPAASPLTLLQAINQRCDAFLTRIMPEEEVCHQLHSKRVSVQRLILRTARRRGLFIALISSHSVHRCEALCGMLYPSWCAVPCSVP
jgi:hypothetical protein